jgi:hypothetical protein
MPGRERTLIEQAVRLREDFPDGVVRLRPTSLLWTGRLTPTPLSREYTIRIRYARGQYPKVTLIEPRLEPEERQELHHLYPDGTLCLHKLDEWDTSMWLVETIIPWTTEWLAHYELWKVNHRWHGDGDPADGQAPAGDRPRAPVVPANRADRRRAARLEARRARRERRGAGIRP